MRYPRQRLMPRRETDGLTFAAAMILRPLVKRLLACGVPFGRLEARLRELVVEVAETEFALASRRQTDSRIALLTGINRKEVRRLRGRTKQDAPHSFTMNYATSVISRWRGDPRMTDRSGRPRPLPYSAARGPSFMSLARKVTVDLAPGVLLDELLRSGAAELREGDIVVLKGDTYVPPLPSTEGLQILAEDPPELIETILQNIFKEATESLLQRKVYYDNLGSAGAARVRAALRREAERFLRRMNRLLARHDRDRNPKAAGGSRYYAGIGVYVFERPTHADTLSAAHRATRRTTKEQKQ